MFGAPSLDAFFAAKPEVHSDDEGEVRLWRPEPGMLVTQVAGMLSGELARPMEQALAEVAAGAPRYLAFNDWERMTDYESEARVRLTRASVEIFPKIDKIHFLVKARIVAIGVRAASLVLRGFVFHPERAGFEATLRGALTSARAA